MWGCLNTKLDEIHKRMLLYRISKWSIKTQETKNVYGGGGTRGKGQSENEEIVLKVRIIGRISLLNRPNVRKWRMMYL
jgi:hypothetical protein